MRYVTPCDSVHSSSPLYGVEVCVLVPVEDWLVVAVVVVVWLEVGVDVIVVLGVVVVVGEVVCVSVAVVDARQASARKKYTAVSSVVKSCKFPSAAKSLHLLTDPLYQNALHTAPRVLQTTAHAATVSANEDPKISEVCRYLFSAGAS